MMKNIYDLLEKIGKRPSMYLGRKSISCLRSFLDGYEFALYENSLTLKSIPPLGVLHIWIANKFGWGPTSAGWNTILLQENQGDEEKALDHFFALLPEFKMVKPVWMGSIKIGEDNIAFRQTKLRQLRQLGGHKDEDEQSLISIPDKMYLVEFSDQGGWYNYQIKEDKLLDIDWDFGDRSEALESMKNKFGKPIYLTVIAESEVLPLYENIIKFC